MTRQVIENTLRSTVFLAAFPAMYLAVICLKNQLKLPESRFWYGEEKRRERVFEIFSVAKYVH